MRIQRVEIENVRNIARLVLEPKRLTVVKGSNGTGKTTIIESVRAVFEGGFDGRLVRLGETIAKIRLTLDDGTTIERTVNRERKSSTLTIKSADGEIVPSPQKFVESLASGFAYDPLAFLSAKPDKRAKFVEQFADVAVASAEIQEAVNDSWWINHYDPKDSAFSNIDRIYEAGYERRAEINRKVRDLDGTIKTLRGGIETLNENGEDWSAAEASAGLAYREQSAALRIAEQTVRDQANAARQAEEVKHKSAIATAQAEYSAAMAAARQRLETAQAEAAAAASANKETIARMENEELQRLQSEQGPAVAEARAAHEHARTKLTEWHKAKGAREQVDRLEAEVKEKAGQAVTMDRVLDNLKKLRLEKLSQVPIEGLELRDGKVFVGGIEFDALNTAKKIEIALQIAAQKPGELEFMLLDQAEHLDEANWEEFKQGVLASGFQVIAARVDDGALTVEVA